MFRVFRHHMVVGSLLEASADLLVCFLAVVAAISLQDLPSHLRETTPPLALLLIASTFALLMALVCAALGVYRRSGPVTLSSVLGRTVVALVIVTILAYALFGVLPEGDRARQSLGTLLLYATVGMVLARPAFFSVRRTGFASRRVLIVGTGPDARDVARDLEAIQEPTFIVVGFLPTGGASDVTEVDARRILPRESDLCTEVERLRVEEVVVAVREQRGGGVPMQALLDCRVRGVPVTNLSAFYERTRGEVPIDYLKSSWLVYGQGFVQNVGRTWVKRVFDVLASSALIAITWPVMIAAALAIRLESAGPVIFRQERTGRAGRSFMCLKFRSMCVDAEKDGVARWATTSDQRITRVGRLIRKTRIDELPQLLNVLRGEMSLVGPRPERPAFVSQLKTQIPFYDIRHSVKPGLTGWAQVRFSYGASLEDARRKLQFDLYYVKNHSLFLDLLILFETIRVILYREGAR